MTAHKNTMEEKMDILIYEKKRTNNFLNVLCTIELLKYKDSLSLPSFLSLKESIKELMDLIEKI